ncbi:Cu(I)-responsive transcriptional regulator [Alkalicaulis satelles]|uniref:Cu(I)-responsive transcriptional regulator n=1 Tax=Alkalicaulis satelles TaxID=2609175 RepID=A0A5M6ZM89_9PROT|nr:Cu(I)-responsive transcriptional regulator [Alkalicaulis satelles]KAA5805430.1 Cu(I)-responsive transcriptional regulator [Alkalicaulis satelles]
MNIGEAAKASGISRKMIRYYEEIALLEPGRTANGYRVYAPQDIHTLRFISAARRLGFSVPDVKALLALWQDRSRSSADVKRLTDGHLRHLRARVAELNAMIATLETLAGACDGDERPDCPIINRIASTAEPDPA